MHDRGVSSVLSVFLALALAGPVFADPPSAFTEEALARGLDYTMSPYPQAQGYLGQGCGFVDLDADGDPDVVLIGRADGRVGIFENVGGGTFVDRSLTSGIPLMVQQNGFAAADYNADGLLDLYVTQMNQLNVLLENSGSFTFSDVTLSAGVSGGAGRSTGPAWGDYDNDGWPDLYVPNYQQPNFLFRNTGLNTFLNTAPTLGVSGPSDGLSFQAIWTDFDRDGDVDIYLSNDRYPEGFPNNYLWRNDGTGFLDVTVLSGAGVGIYSMGIGAGDIDDNGYPDYYLTNINAYDSGGQNVGYDGQNPLILNQGNGTFVDQSASWGVGNGITSWAAIFFDYDNDTFDDIYVNNQFEPNSFFHCAGTLPCTQMAADLEIRASFDPVYDLDDDLPTIASYNSAVADVDGDGDLDLLVNNLGSRAELFINHEGEKRHWVRYDIVGEHPNTYALGAAIDTTAGGKTQFHEIYAGGNGYLGQNELTVHVGLANSEIVDQTVVQWPSAGPTRTLTGLPADSTWSIYPPSRLCDADGDGIDNTDFEAFAACFLAGFSAGCEMMDFDGDSDVYSDDLSDCFVTVPADCNGNGTEDLAEIMLDLSLDADDNQLIDCCEAGPATEPNPVGATLTVDKNGALQPVLSWTAPAVDGSHAAATSYDVFRALTEASAQFDLFANAAGTSLADTDGTAESTFYLLSARNDCGSSGEEPF